MCVFCNGKIKKSTTDYIEKNDNHVILIQNVPCEQCEQCGETFFKTANVKVIECTLENIQRISSEITLTVVDYEKNVA